MAQPSLANSTSNLLPEPTDNEREMHMRRACARVLSPRSFLLLARAQLAAHTQPGLRADPMALALRLLHVSRRVAPDLTWL